VQFNVIALSYHGIIIGQSLCSVITMLWDRQWEGHCKIRKLIDLFSFGSWFDPKDVSLL